MKKITIFFLSFLVIIGTVSAIDYSQGIPSFKAIANDDFDGDGHYNINDPDMDGDGILDDSENAKYPDSTPLYMELVDFDQDHGFFFFKTSIPNVFDHDSDNDCILDHDESGGRAPPVDTDGDGHPDFLDLDSDGDGLTDREEVGSESYPQGQAPSEVDWDDPPFGTPAGCPWGNKPRDSDGDGIPDYLDNDTDNDGIPDGVDPAPLDENNDEDNDGIIDADEYDSDGDGIPDDSDGDGTPDYLDDDSDNDGIKDGDEYPSNQNYLNKFHFNNPDTDGDGLNDGYEITFGGGHPVNCQGGTSDTDGDGLTDLEEQEHWTDCSHIDTDRDSINDYDEINQGTNPLTGCDPLIPKISDPYSLSNTEISLDSRGTLPKGYYVIFNASESIPDYVRTNIKNNQVVWSWLKDGASTTQVLPHNTIGWIADNDVVKGLRFNVEGSYSVILTVAGQGRIVPNSVVGPTYYVAAPLVSCTESATLEFEVDDASDLGPFESIEITSVELTNEDDEELRSEFGGNNYPVGHEISFTTNLELNNDVTYPFNVQQNYISIYDSNNNLVTEDSMGNMMLLSSPLSWTPKHTFSGVGDYRIVYSTTVNDGSNVYSQSTEKEIKVTAGGVIQVLTNLASQDILPGQALTLRFKGYHFNGLFDEIYYDAGNRETYNGVVINNQGSLQCSISSTVSCPLDNEVDYSPVYENLVPGEGEPCGCYGTIYKGESKWINDGTEQKQTFNIDFPFSYDSKNSCGEDRICQVVLEAKDNSGEIYEETLNLYLPGVQTCGGSYENSLLGNDSIQFVGYINDNEQSCECKYGYSPELDNALSIALGRSTNVCTLNLETNTTDDDSTGQDNEVWKNNQDGNSNGNSNGLSKEGEERDSSGLTMFLILILVVLAGIFGFEFYRKKKTGMFFNPFKKSPTSAAGPSESTSQSSIKKFISDAKSAGEDPATIKQNLMNSGWPENEIDKYI